MNAARRDILPELLNKNLTRSPLFCAYNIEELFDIVVRNG
jgi:hypothetical protein